VSTGRPPARKRTAPRKPSAPDSIPRRLLIATFHVRDLARVDEVVRSLHRKPNPRDADRGRRRGSRPIARTNAGARGEQGPLHLVDDNHVVFVAPPGAAARTALQMIERELGDAVEHVDTRSIEIPDAARAAWAAARRAELRKRARR
jgi:hypothetical protein